MGDAHITNINNPKISRTGFEAMQYIASVYFLYSTVYFAVNYYNITRLMKIM